MFAWVSRGFLVLAIALAAWAAWPFIFSYDPSISEPSLVVEWPGPDLGELNVGLHEVTIRVTNPSSQTRRVIGVTKVCGQNACAQPKVDAPILISPGCTIEFPCVLDIRGAAPFEAGIHLYLEENGIREAKETIRGIAVVPKVRTDVGRATPSK